MADDLVAELSAIVGRDQVLDESTDAAWYLTEWRGAFSPTAAAVVLPGSVDEISQLMRLAARENLAIVAQGGNTGTVGGSAADDGRRQIILNLQRLNRIRALDTDEATLTVEAGCILADAQRAASNAGMILPIELASAERCRIGGNLATNAGGLNVVRYGNTRDRVLGLEVVLADGRVWDNLTGLHKDNSGYDLNDLFVGSEGTLGVITAAVLELADAPVQETVAFCGLDSVEAAYKLSARLRRASGQHVSGCELISAQALRLACRHTPDCEPPFATDYPWYLLVEVSSAAKGDWLAPLLEDALENAVVEGQLPERIVARDAAARAALWRLRTAIPAAQTAEGASIKHDISLPASRLAAFLEAAITEVKAAVPGIRPCPFGHIGDGNLHFNLTRPTAMSDAAFRTHEEHLHRLVHDRVVAMRGSVAAEHGVGRLKIDEIVRVKPAVEIDMLRAVKRAFDPDNRLNPGVLVRLD